MMQVLKYQRPAIWWALFVLLICNIKMGDSVNDSPMFFAGFDKLVHCGLFFVFAVFVAYGWIRQVGAENFKWTAALKVFMIALCFGALIEVLQLYIFTWRNGDFEDLFADAVGVGMGVFSILVTLNASANAKS
ncbi:VanZ family protein [Mucilaginibacter myungsuensis]|uniref:VanZ family protein n=1 Tax=Mucilaginibacter myungsuensis TaxID=649104 RepID=A0A929KWE3_9SPHI|nr:VanZ family protein [Mucilaginibacter myungsuensis]MBE9661678.1 VanZ family protein [Mucilaginibacter myungsuensis]MDN3597822.1 VanZ family protein [Mucilaginibacter myungsuensis]